MISRIVTSEILLQKMFIQLRRSNPLKRDLYSSNKHILNMLLEVAI